MNNKKTILKGLAFGVVLSNIPTNYVANAIGEYKAMTREKVELNNFKKYETEKTAQNSKLEKINKNIVKDAVLEITLTDGDYVPDLRGNPNGYETIKVSTTGDKKLESKDYANLKNSGIPNIDLSSAMSNSIPSDAFRNAEHLISFKFPQGVTVIESNAFYNCRSFIGNLVIPDSVTSIGGNAFYGCSGFTGDLVIPGLVTNIGASAFYGCSGFTGELVIPSSVTSIGNYAFENCRGFTGELIIPDSVTNIGSSAFDSCRGFTGNLVIPASVTSIGTSTFEGCSGFTGNLIIPDSVTSIGKYAFYRCSGFTGNLIIPDSVTSIGNYAFNGCSGFTGDLVIPDLVTSIGDYTFASCSGFTGDLIIPNSVTSIGDSAFNRCSGFTGELIIPNSVTSIESDTFSKCSGFTGNLIIPDSVTSIGDSAFNGCSGLTGNLVIPDSVTSIGTFVFSYCYKIEKILIKTNSSDSNTDYKKNIIDQLPNSSTTVIDIPYDFNITGTWLETTKKTVGKPVIKNVIDGVESELINNMGEAVSLYIPSLYQESNITVLKDNKQFDLPTKNSEGKHIFTEAGVYKVTVNTDLGNTSVINFEVEDPQFRNAEEAVAKAEVSKYPIDIEDARDKVNKLPESAIKDQLQDRLDSIFPNNLQLDLKTITSNVDIYIKSENALSMSLNTNSTTFEDFSGVDDMENKNTVELTISSSLPYQLNAYLPTEIQNSNNSNTMDKQILNIKENSENDYQTFTNTADKIILKDDCGAGNNLIHGVDIKLKGGVAHKSDVYKATIKFEAQQK